MWTKEDRDSIKFGPHRKLWFSMGLKSTQSWPEPERSIASRMCWWDILRTRTTSKLALQVAKHLNVRRRWRAQSPIIIWMWLKSGQCRRTSNGQKKNKSWARDLQRDGPGRIRARDHLLPRLLQNAPGAWGGGGVSSEKSLCWTQACPSPCWSKSSSASYR